MAMRLVRLAVVGLIALAWQAHAAKLVLVAGGEQTNEPVQAVNAKLVAPFAVDFGRDGAIFIAELTGQRVRAIDSSGLLRTIAGMGEKGDAGDGGPALQARFNGMHSLLVGRNGEVFVADTWNARIRKIDLGSGVVAAFAGTGRKGFAGDGGPAASAQFGGVYCLAWQPGRDRMLVADLDNRRVRAINLKSGVVETIAGNGQRGVPHDGGDAKQAPLVDPRAVAADALGNVYILERAGDALRVVDPSGRIATVAGRGARGLRDEQGREPLRFKGPKHLCVDQEGDVLIADTENHLIRKYSPKAKTLVNIAGTGTAGSAGLGGPPLNAQLNQPHGVHVHSSGVVYIADSTNNRILKIEP